MSMYAFGLTGGVLSVSYVFLQIKVAELGQADTFRFLFWEIPFTGPLGPLGIISLFGLLGAAVTQPLAGWLSDRHGGNTLTRLPFILLGGVGLVVGMVLFPLTNSILWIIIAFTSIQVMASLAQGPANALIYDNASVNAVGRASGFLNLLKFAGAGVCTLGALSLTGFYTPATGEGRVWLWVGIIGIAGLLLVATLWTVITMRVAMHRPRVTRRRRMLDQAITASAHEHDGHIEDFGNLNSDYQANHRTGHNTDQYTLSERAALSTKPQASARKYAVLIISSAFVLSAFAALGRYTQPYLSDVINLSNPQHGALPIVIIMLASALLATVPSGLLLDRIGKENVLLLGGIMGAISTVLLAFVTTLTAVIFIGALMGAAIGVLLTAGWTMANFMVSTRSVARDLSWVNLASLAGGALVYGGGGFLDQLNAEGDNLGYRVLAFGVSIILLVATSTVYLLTHGEFEQLEKKA